MPLFPFYLHCRRNCLSCLTLCTWCCRREGSFDVSLNVEWLWLTLRRFTLRSLFTFSSCGYATVLRQWRDLSQQFSVCTLCRSGYTRCPRRNVPDFGRVFLMLKYTDITQNTYVQSWKVTEIMAKEKRAHTLYLPADNLIHFSPWVWRNTTANQLAISHWTAHAVGLYRNA